MKKILQFYVMFFLSFSILFIALFHTPLFVGQNVLFYRGLGLLSVWSLVVGACWVMVKKRGLAKKISNETFVAALVVSASLNLVFFVLFPVTFDRSVTMFLLNDLKVNAQITACTGLSKSDMQNHLINGYVLGDGAVDRRINEQSKIGMVKGSDKCIGLTPKAIQFLIFSGIVSKLYGLNNK